MRRAYSRTIAGCLGGDMAEELARGLVMRAGEPYGVTGSGKCFERGWTPTPRGAERRVHARAYTEARPR